MFNQSEYKLNWQRIDRANRQEQELADLAAVETRRLELTRVQYAEWLKLYYWEYFFTTTFRKPRKEPYYALQHVWNELAKYFVAMSFMGVEPHQSGDLHIHGLISGAGPGWRPEIKLPWEIWQGLFTRFGRSKVEACNSNEAVTGYCSKYILKQQSRVADYYGVFGSSKSWHDNLLGGVTPEGQSILPWDWGVHRPLPGLSNNEIDRGAK